MWAGVRARFRQFHGNLLLTEDQVADGSTKHRGVRRSLNAHYYGSSSETANSFLVGSWGKDTCVRPPRDVDIFFVLPVSVYYRFETYSGNKQSALLQEVKQVLEQTYPTTTMRGDGQVVVVRFDKINVEVVPAFATDTGRYLICDTNAGGRHEEADPETEKNHIATVHTLNNYNLRPIIRMLKAWQAHCNVPLKSFCIELAATDFIQQSPWREKEFFYYDWIMRDFFLYLYSKANQHVFVPGTYEPIFLGDEWQSRAESVYNHALKACEYEHIDWIVLAGEEWRNIFGPQIPSSV